MRGYPENKNPAGFRIESNSAGQVRIVKEGVGASVFRTPYYQKNGRLDKFWLLRAVREMMGNSYGEWYFPSNWKRTEPRKPVDWLVHSLEPTTGGVEVERSPVQGGFIGRESDFPVCTNRGTEIQFTRLQRPVRDPFEPELKFSCISPREPVPEKKLKGGLFDYMMSGDQFREACDLRTETKKPELARFHLGHTPWTGEPLTELILIFELR